MTAGAHMNATPSDVGTSEIEAADGRGEKTIQGKLIQRTFSGFDLSSVFKFGSAFYLSLAAAWVVGSLLLFMAAKASGLVENVEGFVRESGFDGFTMTWFGVFRVLFLTGALAAVILTLLTLLSAFLFNRVADVFGGIQLKMIQSDADPEVQEDSSPAP